MHVIQLSDKRTGSTFLQNAFNTHPDIAGLDEIFVKNAFKKGLKKSGVDPYPFVKNQMGQVEYFKKVMSGHLKDSIVMKFMYNQAECWKEL